MAMVDANDVVEELVQTIAQLHKQLAIIRVQLANAEKPPTPAP